MDFNAFARGAIFGQSLQGNSAAGPAITPLPSPNPLEQYFNAHTTGPGIWKWRHYFPAYHRHFAKFIGRDVHVLEIGVLGGGSLGMWRHYFGPRSRIYGVDINDACRENEGEGVKIFIGDQGDRNFWANVRAQVPVLDIVIDDGSHNPEHQIVTLEEMLPHLRPGGVFMCEDVYLVENPFHGYIAGLSQWLNHAWECVPGVSDPHAGMKPSSLARWVASVHHYPHLKVIERTEAPVAAFTAPRQGSRWQAMP